MNLKNIKKSTVVASFFVLLGFIFSSILFIFPSKTHASKFNISIPSNYLGLVGHWTFDGKDTPWTSASAATAKDKSGNGNTGTLTSMTQGTSVVPGIQGQGLYFDGSDDYVTAGDPATLDVGIADSLSMSFWIKNKVAAQSSGVPIRKRALGALPSAAGYLLQFGTNDGSGTQDDLGLAIDDGTNYGQVWINNGFNDLGWHHVVAIINRGDNKLHMYLDGVLRDDTVTFQSISSVGALTNAVNFDIGGTSLGSQTVNGSIDDVRVYNRALSASEVLQLYNMGR